MTTTSTPPPATQARMLQRARWLRSLGQDERDRLIELPLRAVDARFEEWLRASADDPAAADRP